MTAIEFGQALQRFRRLRGILPVVLAEQAGIDFVRLVALEQGVAQATAAERQCLTKVLNRAGTPSQVSQTVLV